MVSSNSAGLYAAAEAASRRENGSRPPPATEKPDEGPLAAGFGMSRFRCALTGVNTGAMPRHALRPAAREFTDGRGEPPSGPAATP